MDNIQDKLNSINDTWGKIPENALNAIASRKRVLVYELILIDELDSQTDAMQKYGESVRTGLRENIPQGKYYFAYGINGKRSKRQTSKAKKIVAFLNGQQVGIYDKVIDAAIALNIHRTCIQHTLSGKYAQYKGYTFKYA